MTTYIAEFKAAHWKQEGGEIDPELLQGKIKRESSVHFYNLLAGEKHNVALEDISVEITKTAPFNG